MKSIPTKMHFTNLPIHAAGLGLCAVLTLAVYLLAIRPVHHQRVEEAALRNEVLDEQQLVSRLESSIRILDQQHQQLAKSNAEHGLELKAAGQVNHQLARLNRLATQCKLQVHSVRPDRPRRSGSHLQQVPIHVDGKGDFRTFVYFLQKLNQGLTDTGVWSFQLSGNPSNPSSEVQFTMILNWYTLPGRLGTEHRQSNAAP